MFKKLFGRFNNPQHPHGGPVPMPGPAPTELMPLLGYTTEGKIPGIQQAAQFMPFAQGPNRVAAIQSVYNIGSGIQMGQFFNQPLVDTSEG